MFDPPSTSLAPVHYRPSLLPPTTEHSLPLLSSPAIPGTFATLFSGTSAGQSRLSIDQWPSCLHGAAARLSPRSVVQTQTRTNSAARRPEASFQAAALRGIRPTSSSTRPLASAQSQIQISQTHSPRTVPALRRTFSTFRMAFSRHISTHPSLQPTNGASHSQTWPSSSRTMATCAGRNTLFSVSTRLPAS